MWYMYPLVSLELKIYLGQLLYDAVNLQKFHLVDADSIRCKAYLLAIVNSVL